MSDSSHVQWPPRSPHEALLSSPSGRDRLRRMRERGSPTPSPKKLTLRGSPAGSNFQRRLQQARKEADGLSDEAGGEDEETLQLQLQAIEARLKLKKLRQARSRDAGLDEDVQRSGREASRSPSRGGVAVPPSGESNRPSQTSVAASRKASGQGVQVPLSPPQRATAPAPQRSPGRVLLGIDKGLKGRDVSLGRAPVSRAAEKAQQALAKNTYGSIQRLGSSDLDSPLLSSSSSHPESQPKSFSERIAESRDSDRLRQEREEKNRKGRSAGFGVDNNEIEAFKTATPTQGIDDPFLAEAKGSEPSVFTREEVLRSYNESNRESLRQPSSNPGSHSSARKGSQPQIVAAPSRTPSSTSNKFPGSGSARSGRSKAGKKKTNPGEETKDPNTFESFSGLHLSKRTLPHNFVTRTLSGKEVLSIPKLLKDVKAPTFDPPDVEGDWVLLGVVAAKSNPVNHKNSKPAKENEEEPKAKFMVLTLTDLKWEVELFLFQSAFERFWKLSPGTVVAILNPSIMPPPASRRATGKFSLTFHSSDDTILEIGTARDLDFCKSVKKDGKLCNQWIDKRHTQFCTYHVDISVRKTMAGRMEVNTMDRLFDPDSKRRRNRGDGQYQKPYTTEWDHQGGRQDIESGARYFVAPSASGVVGRSTANLLDSDDVAPDAFHRGSTKEERMRRRLAENEREREIARKLGASGNGMGGAYLRASQPKGPRNGQIDMDGNQQEAEPVDAQSLGLNGGMAAAVSLSPIKRKRVQSGTEQDTGLGWGSALKKGLPANIIKAPNSETKPARKKTRFITAKGIREAGRDSFGRPSSAAGNGDEEEDDGLDIV